MAMCEVTKAATVLLFACGLFHLMHKNLDDVAERVVQVLHVNPEGKLSNLFFDLASHSSDRNLWVLALGTLAYASVRLTEAYGLWREREWAQWFSLLFNGLVFAAGVVLDAASSELAQVCCARHQHRDFPIHAEPSRKQTFESCPQHRAAILHAHWRGRTSLAVAPSPQVERS